MSTLKLNDGAIFYQMAGSGAPIVLLHAGVADSRMWDPQIDSLAAHHRVIRYDMRGFGKSTLPDGTFAHHEDILALVDGLELDPVWLVGASFGGGVAVDFTLTYPQRVRGLVLAAPAVSGYQATGAVKAFGEREDELLEADKLDEAVELNVRMWVDGPHRGEAEVDPDIRSLVAEMQHLAFTHPEPERVALRKLDPPALDRLHEIQVPVLVITGALDVSEFVQMAEKVAAQVAHGKYRVIPGVAHLPSLEAPQEFSRLVLEFIQMDEKR